jgi:putative ABC transport system ATP-binding protein
VLEFRDVRKYYRAAGEVVRAVDGVALTVEAGQLMALYGPSGSGKSTLLRIAGAMEPPDGGAVLVDGCDVTSLSDRDAAHYRLHVLGWVSQQADLPGGLTALDNAAIKQLAALGNMRRARQHVAPLLRRLGMTERMHHRTRTLSMGERQRVLLARALSMDPQVVLADEPTGNLDSRRSREVFELLREETHTRKIATLLVTHDERAAAYADKVYTLEDGALRDPGCPADAAGAT